MKIGPKYKIARRLNAPVFEKTQSPKYALSLARKSKKTSTGGRRGPRQKSAFGEQLVEKQKARFTYLLTEKQFSNYVRKAISSKESTVPTLFALLETRLDNVVYKMGLATTRSGARQMVSHGHVTVNGRRLNIPSYHVVEGNVISVREGSTKKPLFVGAEERMKNFTAPTWIQTNPDKIMATITGTPTMAAKVDTIFDLNAVIEFYSR